MAVLAIGAIGAAVGGTWFAAGALGMSGAALGWNVGLTVGGMLFGPKGQDITQQGPRLGDLKVQASTYGNPIPIFYGAMRSAGNVIWSANIVETAHTTTQSSGGKGGGGGGSVTQTSYSYSQSFAVGIGAGEIAGVRKIWANGKLIYNLSDTADIATIVASNKSAKGIRIYTGSETQTADSLIQASVGAADCPAYRGVAYVVFENLQLADYGNRMPNLEFEVVDNGTTTSFKVVAHTLPNASWLAIAYGRGIYCAISWGTICATSPDGTTWTQGAMPSSRYWRSLVWNGSVFCAISDTSVGAISYDGLNWIAITLPFSSGIVIRSKGQRLCVTGSSQVTAVSTDNGTTWATGSLGGGAGSWAALASNGAIFCAVSGAGGPTCATSHDGLTWTSRTMPQSIAWRAVAWNGSVFCAIANATTVSATSPDGITWTQGVLPSGASWIDIASNGDGFIAISYGGGVAKSEDGLLWTTLTVPSPYYAIASDGGNYCAVQYASTATAVIIPFETITISNPALSSIVSDICTRAGLTAGQIDVTALTDEVHGYVVQRGTARSQIEQLMRAFYFDAVESNGKVKFVKRGGSVAVSIPEDDLAAREYGSTPPDTLVINRQQEMELPVEMHVQYMDSAAAYQVGSQYSQRLITDSENKSSINLAIAMTAAKAKQIADVLMYDAWTSRTGFAFQTGWKYSYLEPTDVIQITSNGRTYTARIIDEDYALTSNRMAVLEDTTVYTQSAAAAGLPTPDESVAGVPLTDLLLLDIPLLRDQDDGVGFYAAACGYGDGWTGAQAFKSNDDGATWASFGSGFLNEATIGSASTALGDFTQNIFDESSSVTVALINGELASDTELNVLNGANVALLGDEIIQFRDATLVSASTYTLTGLLRGRQGTEWARSTHAIGDRFVLLDSSTTYLFTGSSGEYDAARKYRGVSFGGFLDDASNIDFTNTAVAQECYAPVHLGGGRNAALDVILNWIRRTRISGGWNDYSDVPLGEAAESYEVEIWDDANYTSLVRTITGLSAQTTTYTAAQQIADFGSEQAAVYWKVFQLSATRGRGYEARGAT